MAEPGLSELHSDAESPQANGTPDADSSFARDEPPANLNNQQPADGQSSSPLSRGGHPVASIQQNGVTQNAPATPEVLHENNNGFAADTEEASAEGENSDPAPAADEPWTRRLYFVRMPKPEEDNQYAAKVLQEEIDVYKSQVQLLNESMTVVKVSKLHKLQQPH